MKSSAGQKSSKGSVGIESFQGRLRLRLPRQVFGGKQKYLTLGLPDTPENWKLAEAKAKQIESDIAFERFDESLARYRPMGKVQAKETFEDTAEALTIGKLWLKYVEYRKPQVSPTTVANQYATVASHVNKLPTQELTDAIKIRDWLIANLTADAAKRVLVQLGACCRWAQKSQLITDNPFKGMASEIKVKKGSREDLHPFTKEEQQVIIEAFSGTRYSTLVKFLFLSGCRTGEALGLKWKYVDVKFRTITFAESLSGQVRLTTDTKTHKARKLPCNRQLRELLQSYKPKSPNPEELVFDVGHVRTFQDNWQRIVNKLVSEGAVEGYRSQYHTRHTFITHCLEAGVSVVQVAKWVGNSPEIIMKHYAGIIRPVEVPEF